LPRNRDGLLRRHDAELLARVVDDANFANANPLVDADAIVTSAGTFECDTTSLRRVSARQFCTWRARVRASSTAAAMNSSSGRAP
jgi:hypothetical protein